MEKEKDQQRDKHLRQFGKIAQLKQEHKCNPKLVIT